MRFDGTDSSYLVARLHGRVGQLWQGERLAALCQLGSMVELGRALRREGTRDAPTLERELWTALVDEHWTITRSLRGVAQSLLVWLLARHGLQNLELVLRARGAALGRQEVECLLVPLPSPLRLDVDALLSARTPREVARALASSAHWARFVPIVVPRREALPYPEAALEQAYFQELWTRVLRVSGEEATLCRDLVGSEIDLFHWMLVARGRFHHALPAGLLESFHVAGTPLPRRALRRMLQARDLAAAARHAVRRGVDPPLQDATNTPAPEAAQLEALGWSRYARRARRAFRQSGGGLATITGYLALRRVETVNLCRIAAGIGRLPPERLRAELLPRAAWRAGHA